MLFFERVRVARDLYFMQILRDAFGLLVCMSDKCFASCASVVTVRRYVVLFSVWFAPLSVLLHTHVNVTPRDASVYGKYRMWSRLSTVYKLSSVTDGWTDQASDQPREQLHQQHQQQSIATNSSPLIICFGGYAIVSRFHFNKTLLFKYYRWIVVVVVVDVAVVNDQQTEWIKKRQASKNERNEWKSSRTEQIQRERESEAIQFER